MAKKTEAPAAAEKMRQPLTMRDNSLSVFVGLGFYQFSTYTTKPKLQGGVTKEVSYGDQLEGAWNYVYFGYRRGTAKGFVLFGQQVQECEFSVTHFFVNEYLELVIQKE